MVSIIEIVHSWYGVFIIELVHILYGFFYKKKV